MTLKEKTIKYRRVRYEEMESQHSKFAKSLSENEHRNLVECVTNMILDLSPPSGIEGMDNLLLDIIKNENNEEFITAINPIAQSVLHSHHKSESILLGYIIRKKKNEI